MRMKLSKQVIRLDLAKRLTDLNFKRDSLYCWFKQIGTNDWDLLLTEQVSEYYFIDDLAFPAYSVAELGEILQWKKLMIFGAPDDMWAHVKEGDSEADARAGMLIYLIENNLLKLES
jgi:hypothetical protein